VQEDYISFFLNFNHQLFIKVWKKNCVKNFQLETFECIFYLAQDACVNIGLICILTTHFTILTTKFMVKFSQINNFKFKKS